MADPDYIPLADRRYDTRLSCGCLRRFAVPAPAVGDYLSCLTHRADARVVESNAPALPMPKLKRATR